MVLLRLPSGYAKKLWFYCVCHLDKQKSKGFIAFAIRISKKNVGFIASAIWINKKSVVLLLLPSGETKKHWFYYVCHPDKQKSIGFIVFAIRNEKALVLFRLQFGWTKKHWFYCVCHQEKTNKHWFYCVCHPDRQNMIRFIAFAIRIWKKT